MPRHTCAPCAKPMCGLRSRKMLNRSGSSHRVSSWLALPKLSIIVAPFGICTPSDLGVAGDLSHEVQQRRLPADALLDGLWQQAAVVTYRVELIGVCQQCHRQAGGRPRRGLGASGQQIAHEPVDLLVGHLHAVDFGSGEDRHHVVGRRLALLGQDADEVLLHLGRCLHGACPCRRGSPACRSPTGGTAARRNRAALAARRSPGPGSA